MWLVFYLSLYLYILQFANTTSLVFFAINYLISTVLIPLNIYFFSITGILFSVLIPLFFFSIFLYKILFFNCFKLNYFAFFNEVVVYKLNNMFCGISFHFDEVTLSYIFLTGFIAFFANIFTLVYMRNELSVEKFYFYLNAFVISMMILLSSGNWVTLILGWELIGIFSYLLINFWVNKVSTFKAAFKAFTFNKISDASLLIAAVIYINLTKSFNFLTIGNSLNLSLFSAKINNTLSILDVFCFFLILCSCCKSAQLGTHIWLPDSMEAPVPASSLIHSATLVSAGIFVLMKFWVFIKYSYFCYYSFLVWSSVTAIYGAIIAAQQIDLKKILAYSTISHCGYLMMSLFLENSHITILYLYMHGFFKAFSFMAMGNIIVFNLGTQDIRKIGNFFFFKKINFFFLTFSLISLGSAPLTLGFLSKHLFMNIFISTFNSTLFKFLLFIGTLSAFVYSIKIILNLFFLFNKFYKSSVFLKKSKFKKNYKYFVSNMDFNFSLCLFFGLILATYTLYCVALNLNLSSFYLYGSTFLIISHNSINSQFFGICLTIFYIIFVYFFLSLFFKKNTFATQLPLFLAFTIIGFFFL